MKSIIRFVYKFFALFLRAGFITLMMMIVAFFIQNPAKAQKPLLLESVSQSFNYTKDTFELQNTIYYSYDQKGRLINKTTKGAEPCRIVPIIIKPKLVAELKTGVSMNPGWKFIIRM
ncbi:MAG: hypothetical protein U5K79_19075 [Cyclobacteriaceae bacterium]|nr:hypothetical protein [Cyclobacteriaceae bacterium]